ncbi:MAG: hypothetical protein IKY82_01345 [Alistipes sp.]|nr:hypothetical protein [Alistipes sp.]
MKEKVPFDLIGRIKGSVKNWLLPYPFKFVGFALLLAMLVALVAKIALFDAPTNGDITIDTVATSMTINKVLSIALYLAIFFITCSREKVEDEMTAALRGETLKEICYLVLLVWVVARIAMTCVADNTFAITHDDPILAPFIIWVLYYGRFERKMKALRRQSREFKL